MVSFDFGRSESTNQKISFLIARYVPNSAKLTFPAFFFEIAISLTLAAMCAYYRGSLVDRVLTVFSVLGMSIATLVLIIIGQKLLSYDLRLFPISGWKRGIGQIRYLILPWILWVVVSIGYDIRFFRTTILEEVSKDYVRTARAKGLSERKIMFRHVMKNAMIPILTYVVISIPFLLTHGRIDIHLRPSRAEGDCHRIHPFLRRVLPHHRPPLRARRSAGQVQLRKGRGNYERRHDREIPEGR
jgi:peptide/nickel transport system permease protein